MQAERYVERHLPKLQDGTSRPRLVRTPFGKFYVEDAPNATRTPKVDSEDQAVRLWSKIIDWINA